VIAGLVVLIWSSDRFVEGSASIARHLGMSPMVIGMLIVGFGTSAPELVVSAVSALDGRPSLALGNAYGSNIANIALILGATALLFPIRVRSKVLRRELPLLTAITLISYFLIEDLHISRMDGLILLVVFVISMGGTLWMAIKRPDDQMLTDVTNELEKESVGLGTSIFHLTLGLVLLLVSSRVLVWGAVELALLANVSELIIGLTVVAIGTSLPELASTIAAVRKGEHDMAIGNVVGSNLFNTLAVVGIASTIRPFNLDPEILTRDFPVMGLLTLSIFVAGWGWKGSGRICRWEGALLLAAFVGYTGWLVAQVVGAR
jgi:cation:H+ antiporter